MDTIDHHRIVDPNSDLAIRFTCTPATAGEAPRVRARLTPAQYATRFTTRAVAEQCFARYLVGEVLEIVKVVG